MKTYHQPGNTLDYTNATGTNIKSGDVIAFGKGIAIACGDILDTMSGSLMVANVHKLPKKSTDVITAGDPLYYDTTNKELTVTAAGNKRAGIAAYDAGNGVTEAYVLLLPTQSGQAATVAALGATTALVGVDGTGSNAAPLVETEARLDAIEAKIDAVIAALKAAGLMANA